MKKGSGSMQFCLAQVEWSTWIGVLKLNAVSGIIPIFFLHKWWTWSPEVKWLVQGTLKTKLQLESWYLNSQVKSFSTASNYYWEAYKRKEKPEGWFFHKLNQLWKLRILGESKTSNTVREKRLKSWLSLNNNNNNKKPYIQYHKKEKERWHSWLLGRQGWGQLHAGGGLHGLPAFLGLQNAVELFQLSNDVIFDVWSWDLQADTATVKGSCEVTRKHLIDHPRHHWDYLNQDEFPVLGFPIWPFFPKA